MMTQGNGKPTKLQVTVDRFTVRIFEAIKELGVHGTAKSEVVASTIRDWLCQNEEKLRCNGVQFTDDNVDVPRGGSS